MTGIEAFASPRTHKRIHSTLRKLRDKLLPSEHDEDFAVHLQAKRGHQFAAGDIAMMGKCIDTWPKAGVNLYRSRFLFSLPGWHSCSSQSDILQKHYFIRRSVDGNSVAATMAAVLEIGVTNFGIRTQRATQKAFWLPGAAGTEDISIEKIEVFFCRKQELKPTRRPDGGGI
jgi:hypothetical protein